jgi:hypothetical protein
MVRLRDGTEDGREATKCDRCGNSRRCLYLQDDDRMICYPCEVVEREQKRRGER